MKFAGRNRRQQLLVSEKEKNMANRPIDKQERDPVHSSEAQQNIEMTGQPTNPADITNDADPSETGRWSGKPEELKGGGKSVSAPKVQPDNKPGDTEAFPKMGRQQKY
jgi:hypothetical protein